MSRRAIVLAALLTASIAGPAGATQYLVRAGQNWQSIGARAKAGDEIILMPGAHRPVTLIGLHGEKKRPIVIRGLDPEQRPTIEADRYGIRLLASRHVHISDLVIRGATINGLSLEGEVDPTLAAALRPPRQTEPFEPGDFVVTGVTIRETGPAGAPGSAAQRHAMHVRHVKNVRFTDCRVEGWVGSGLEIVGSEEVRVHACAFLGTDDRHEVNGIRVRGGSYRVHIEASRFRDTGDHSVCVGARTSPDDMRPALAPDAEPGSRFEATRVQVMECKMEGGLCAVGFVDCDMAIVRNCTIVQPRRVVVSIRREHDDRRIGTARRCVFGANLITWRPAELKSLGHVGAGADPEGLALERNLWWSPGAEPLAELGPFPGRSRLPQVIDVDPQLGRWNLPATAGAAAFGAHGEW